MTFGDQLLHIRANMLWLGTTHFSTEKFNRHALTQNAPSGKEAIIEALEKAFDAVYTFVKTTSEEDLRTTINFFAGPKSKLQILNLLHDHVSHHRGQLVVYLNLNDIDLPEYVGW